MALWTIRARRSPRCLPRKRFPLTANLKGRLSSGQVKAQPLARSTWEMLGSARRAPAVCASSALLPIVLNGGRGGVPWGGLHRAWSVGAAHGLALVVDRRDRRAGAGGTCHVGLHVLAPGFGHGRVWHYAARQVGLLNPRARPDAASRLTGPRSRWARCAYDLTSCGGETAGTVFYGRAALAKRAEDPGPRGVARCLVVIGE